MVEIECKHCSGRGYVPRFTPNGSSKRKTCDVCDGSGYVLEEPSLYSEEEKGQ